MSQDNTRMMRRLATIIERLSAHAADKSGDALAEDSMEFRPGDPLNEERDAARAVPWTLRVAAALSWRIIVIAVAAAGLVWIAARLSVIVMPVAIALLLAVLLEPLVGWLTDRLNFPRTLSAALGLLIMVAIVVAALSQAGSEIFRQLPRLFTKANTGVNELITWLQDGPLRLDMTVVHQALATISAEVTAWAQANSSMLASSALSVTSSVASVLSSILIMLFCLFFFLKEGRTIWLWVVRLFPAPARTPLHESVIRGWVTLGSYVRTQIQVAAIDAIGIGLGAFFLGLPMVVPIIVLVFFFSFVPIVGAVVSGAIAVLVALVDQGLTAGIIMLVIIFGVQQLESNVLQPFLMSRAVSLHPMAVLLVVAAAGSVAGIPGAVFGVPIAAFLNATFLYLHGYDSTPELATDPQRPGGPPGMLDDLVAASLPARKAAAAAEQQATVEDAQGAQVSMNEDPQPTSAPQAADSGESEAVVDKAAGLAGAGRADAAGAEGAASGAAGSEAPAQ